MTEHFVYGVHAVTALLNNNHRKTNKLYCSQTREDARVAAVIELATHKKIPIEMLSANQMKQRFSEFVHQGVIASAATLPAYYEADLPHLLEQSKKPCLILILDGITDPHNLGACLRTADAAGVDFVIIPKDKSAHITPVVSKVASGAAESIPVVTVTNLARSIEVIKQEGVWVYGAAGEASKTIYELTFQHHVALVLGAEGSGLRRLTRDLCDDLFALPMAGSVDSLNVSVAAGVSLYEVVRQRK